MKEEKEDANSEWLLLPNQSAYQCQFSSVHCSVFGLVRFGWPLLNRFRQTGEEEGKEEDAAADKRGKRREAEMH